MKMTNESATIPSRPRAIKRHADRSLLSTDLVRILPELAVRNHNSTITLAKYSQS